MSQSIFNFLDTETSNSITSEQKELLHRAIKSLSRVCDGALTQDAQGFNASHTTLGKHLACLDAWDDEVYEIARSLALFYQNQLRFMGFSIAAIRAIPIADVDLIGATDKIRAKVEQKEREAKRLVAEARQQECLSKRTIDTTKDAFLVRFERDDKDFSKLLTLVQTSKARGFDYATSTWHLSLVEENLDIIATLCNDHNFFAPADIQETIDAISNGKIKPFEGSIKPHSQGFIVAFPYDASKVTKIKACAGAGGYPKFDPTTKSWICPLALLPVVVKAFPDFDLDSSLADKLKLSLVAQSSEQQEQAALLANLDAIKARLLGETLADGKKARDYQVEGVLFLLKEKKAILAYDVGLGKTLTALLAARELGNPIIVICPASVRTNWGREATSIGMQVKTYSWAKFPEESTLPKQFTLILDESHKAKNLKTAQTKNAMALASKASAVYMLTGTPLPNGRPIETYPLLKMASSMITNNKSYYEQRYCNAHQTRWGWDNSGASHLDEWSKLAKDKILHKKKEDCLKSLPDLMRALVTVDGTDEQNKLYRETVNNLFDEYQNRVAKGQISEADGLVLMGILRKTSSMIKVDAAIEKAQEILDSSTSDKVLIFTDFRESSAAIAAHFKAECISGEVDSTKRQAMVDRFTNNPSNRVLVATIKAAGEGLNIQAANHIILVDRTFVPKDYVQAEGRAHRSGQERTVFSWWLQYNSSDTKVDSLITQKQERIELALEGERKTMRGIQSPGALALQVLKDLFADKN